MARRRKLTATEFRTVVEQAITSSDFFDNSEIQDNQQRALNSYLGRLQGKSIPGDADERSHDVADMVEAVTAQIMPAFKSSEIAIFEGNGKDDVEQARLESQICNQVLFDFNDGEIELQAAVRDALLLRNAILLCYVQEQVDVNLEQYENLSDLELAQVQQPTAPLQEIVITSISEADRSDEFPEANLIDVRLTRTTTFRRLEIRSIDPVNFIIDREWTSINPAEATIVGERTFELRGDLIAEGFSKKLVEGLPKTDADTRIGSIARNRNESIPHFHVADPSLDRIEVFRIYMRVDADNDGIAERRRVVYAGQATGGTVLLNEPHPFVPFACGTPFLFPHRFAGLSLFDKLESIENVKSKAITQYTNNLQQANFPELVIADGSVAEGDVTTRKASGIIRADDVNAVRELPVTDIGSSSISFLQYMDKVRAERGGAALDMHSAEAQISSESAFGVDRLMTPREALANLMADTLGQTLIKQLFKLIHANLREFFTGPQDFHVGQDQFVTSDPGEWPARLKVRITAGMSEHQRQQQRGVLEQTLMQQEKLMTNGLDGVLADFQTYYATLIDWSKAGGLMMPRRYWIDPRSEEAQQAMQAKQQQAQQANQEQQDLQERLFATQVLISDRDNRTDLVKHLTQLRFDYFDAVLTSEVEELRVQAQGSEVAAPDPERIDSDQAEGRERQSAELAAT